MSLPHFYRTLVDKRLSESGMALSERPVLYRELSIADSHLSNMAGFNSPHLHHRKPLCSNDYTGFFFFSYRTFYRTFAPETCKIMFQNTKIGVDITTCA